MAGGTKGNGHLITFHSDNQGQISSGEWLLQSETLAFLILFSDCM